MQGLSDVAAHRVVPGDLFTAREAILRVQRDHLSEVLHRFLEGDRVRVAALKFRTLSPLPVHVVPDDCAEAVLGHCGPLCGLQTRPHDTSPRRGQCRRTRWHLGRSRIHRGRDSPRAWRDDHRAQSWPPCVSLSRLVLSSLGSSPSRSPVGREISSAPVVGVPPLGSEVPSSAAPCSRSTLDASTTAHPIVADLPRLRYSGCRQAERKAAGTFARERNESVPSKLQI